MSIIYQDKNTKIVLNNNKITKIASSNVENEAKIQSLAYTLGISPEVYQIGRNTIEMEYIKGIELDRYVKMPGIDKSKLKKLIKHVLNIMYDGGIKHNDLTGKNIIINTEGNIKIIDYGHAKLVSGSVPVKERDYAILRNF